MSDSDKDHTELDNVTEDGSTNETLNLTPGNGNICPNFQGVQNIISKVQQNQKEASSKSDPSLYRHETEANSTKSNSSWASVTPCRVTLSAFQKPNHVKKDEPKGQTAINLKLETLCRKTILGLILASKFKASPQTNLPDQTIPKLADICYGRIKGAILDPDKNIARLIKRHPKMSQLVRDRLRQPDHGGFPNLKDICFKQLLGNILFCDSDLPSLYNQNQSLQVYIALLGPDPPDFDGHPNKVNDIQWGEFHCKNKRLATYLLYPANAAKRPVLLAQSGFVYIGGSNSDKVICYYCNRIKTGWLPGDSIHHHHHRKCIHFNQPV